MSSVSKKNENKELNIIIKKEERIDEERETLAYKLINIIETKRKLEWSQEEIYLNLFHILEKGYDLTEKQKDIINNTHFILCESNKNRELIDDIYILRKKENAEYNRSSLDAVKDQLPSGYSAVD